VSSVPEKSGKYLPPFSGGFGMRVLAYDLYPDRAFEHETGIEYVDIDTLYHESDIVSLNCPLTAETFHLVNRDTIPKMKDGVMIINTGRGQLIDTKALIEALKSQKIGSAGLDVYEEESAYFFEDFSNSVIDDDVLARLLTFNNVLITSHQGFFTREALTSIAEVTMENIHAFVENNKLENEICYKCQRDHCMKKETGRCF
jgi:D-lactate dehydrogenase